jgi:hypothetical protein
MHVKIFVKKQLAGKKRKQATAQIGTNVRARILNARLLAFQSGQLDQSFP